METIFWLCLIGVAWCFLGYPLFMETYARLRPRPLRYSTDLEVPRVSVVIAVRNGAGHVRQRLDNLLAQRFPGNRLEILVVCNGCTDATEAEADCVAREDGRVRVLVGRADEGKAGALNLGAASARGDFLVFADIRQVFEADAIHRLLEPFADPTVGAASGRLVIRRADRAAVEGVRLYWGLETRLRMAESRTGSVVGVTGAIYAVRRECFEPIPVNTILDDVWVPMRIAERGLRVVLVPEAVAVDTPAESEGQEFVRKRRTMVGNLQLLRLLPWLLDPRRNPLFGRYLSHKVLRLLTPLFLLGVVATSGLLPEWPYRVVFVAGIAGYLLGIVGLVLRVRMLSVASAAVLMHLAIFSAFLRFRQHAGGVWASPVPERLIGGEVPAGTLDRPRR